MQRILLLLLLSCLATLSGMESKSTEAPLPIAAPLPLSLRPVLELDRSNQLLMLAKEAKEPARNIQVVQQQLFPWHLIAGLAVLLTVGGAMAQIAVRLSQYRRRIVVEPPAAVARKALQELEAQSLPTKGKFEQFYVQLTNIVRRYVEAQYGIKAPEHTTPEFLDLIRTNDKLSSIQRQSLTDLLTYADEVKFAKRSSTPKDCAIALSYAQELLTPEEKTSV